MPLTEVILYQEEDGTCPLLLWLDGMPPKVQDKCYVRIVRLEEMGHELRRPEGDYLRDDIYELRVSFQRIQYRMLYFYHEGRAVVSHGLVKESEVPPKEIQLAIERMQSFTKDPSKHTHEE